MEKNKESNRFPLWAKVVIGVLGVATVLTVVLATCCLTMSGQVVDAIIQFLGLAPKVVQQIH